MKSNTIKPSQDKTVENIDKLLFLKCVEIEIMQRELVSIGRRDIGSRVYLDAYKLDLSVFPMLNEENEIDECSCAEEWVAYEYGDFDNRGNMPEWIKKWEKKMFPGYEK